MNVPAKPNLLVGRDQQYESLVARLTAGGSTALSTSGQGGAGKTTLATLLAYDRRVHASFHDGVLWAGLGTQPDVARIHSEWETALGLNLAGITDQYDRASKIRSAIGLGSFLIVIDDAWDVDSANLLRCGGPHCAHLLTTRDDGIAREFAGAVGAEKVVELGKDDAWKLLHTLAPEACAVDEAAARQLVQAVGGLPLAVELLGGYLADPKRTALRGARAAAFRELAHPAARLRLARERLGAATRKKFSLEQVIELSLGPLPESARNTFFALGAFAAKPESFELSAALSVCQTSEDTLAMLVGVNLLESTEPGRLRVHQVLSDFARQKRSLAAKRHREHFLEFALEKDAAHDWAALDREYGQVRHAWIGQTREPDDGILDAFALVLQTYLRLRGKWRDQLRLNRAALKTAQRQGDNERISALCNAIGTVQLALGERRGALKHLGRALSIHEANGDLEGQATALCNLSAVYHGLGESHKALECLDRAVGMPRKVDDTPGTAMILNNIGLIYHDLDNDRKALKYLGVALASSEESGDIGHLATVLHNLGLVYHSRGRQRKALHHYGRSLALWEEVGDRHHVGVSLTGVASVYHSQKKYREALQYFERALEIRMDVGDRDGIAAVLSNMAKTLAAVGERTSAMRYLQQALPLRRSTGDRAGEAATRFSLAMLYYQENRFAEAIQELERAVQLREATARPDVQHYRTMLHKFKTEHRVREKLAKLLPPVLLKRIRWYSVSW